MEESDSDWVAYSIPRTAVPITEPTLGQAFKELLTALRSLVAANDKPGASTLGRLSIGHEAHGVLLQLTKDRTAPRLQYKLQDIGETVGGGREIDIAMSDAKRLLPFLEGLT